MINNNSIKTLFFTLLSVCYLYCNDTRADIIEIDDGDTFNTSIIDDNYSVEFIGNSTGNLNADTNKIISSITTNNSGVGTVNLSNFTTLTTNNNIGTSSKKINQIIFSGSQILSVFGNIYTLNGITTTSNGDGDLNLFGVNSIINSNIGAYDNKLNTILVEANNISIQGDVFTERLNISDSNIDDGNRSVTISNSSTTNQLGIVTVGNGSSLTLNSTSSMDSLATTATSTLTIGAGKQATIAEATTLRGTLNIGIDRSDSSTAAILLNSGAATVNNSAIDFDYSNASYLKSDDSYNFINAATVTLNPNNIVVTDNSILLKPTLANNSGNVINAVDSATTNRLSAKDLTTTTFMLDNTSLSGIDTVRTELLKISTQGALEDALHSLQVAHNNMIQMASLDLSNQVDNIIKYRTQAINYADYSKNKKAKAQNKGLWGEVFGNTSRQDTREQEAGYTTNSAGVTFGFDDVLERSITNHTLGIALSYGHADAKDKSFSKQNTSINSYQLALYNYNIGNLNIGLFNENILNIGYNQYNSKRTIAVNSYSAQAQADFGGLQYGAKTSLGYNFTAGKTVIIAPVASIKYAGLKLSDYQEKNAGDFGLDVKNNNFQLVTSDIGLRIIGQYNDNLSQQLSSSWSHNLNHSGSKSTSYFIGDEQTAARNVGVDLLQDLFNVGTQLNFKTGQNTTLMLKYELQSGDKFVSHSASLRYDLAF